MEAIAKIMVVDDEKRICENIEKILSKNNYEVVSAISADEALEKMATESFSLLISDIIMPGKNGLELLKLVRKEWPLTKAVMITAYASTDTAMKAIRMGALDYIPKPFTPEELRSTVEKALSGSIQEAPTTEKEREQIDIIDIDIPFDREEVARIAGDAYADMLGPSDMPVEEVKAREPLENFCDVGNMVCDIFKKLGTTCKAGIKTASCPKTKAKRKKAAADSGVVGDTRNLIGIDQPFDYQEVISITGPEYVRNLHHEGIAFLPYEELKQNMSRLMGKENRIIDVDMPFDADDVARFTGKTYVDRLSRSDLPVVEVTASEPLENFCEVGDMVCDIFKKLGATCKAGIKTESCPRKKAKKKGVASRRTLADVKSLVGIDMPFDYQEVVEVTGSEYAQHLSHKGMVMVPYEELKENIARLDARREKQKITVLDFPRESIHKNILVIDDEVAVNNNIRKILQKKGYQVDQAVTKDEAMVQINHGDHRVILLDLKIPGVTGLELLSIIRDRRPDARVIMITGYASIETAVEAARMGVVEYLPKPFTPAEIRNATDMAFQMAA